MEGRSPQIREFVFVSQPGSPRSLLNKKVTSGLRGMRVPPGTNYENYIAIQNSMIWVPGNEVVKSNEKMNEHARFDTVQYQKNRKPYRRLTDERRELIKS